MEHEEAIVAATLLGMRARVERERGFVVGLFKGEFIGEGAVKD